MSDERVRRATGRTPGVRLALVASAVLLVSGGTALIVAWGGDNSPTLESGTSSLPAPPVAPSTSVADSLPSVPPATDSASSAPAPSTSESPGTSTSTPTTIAISIASAPSSPAIGLSADGTVCSLDDSGSAAVPVLDGTNAAPSLGVAGETVVLSPGVGCAQANDVLVGSVDGTTLETVATGYAAAISPTGESLTLARTSSCGDRTSEVVLAEPNGGVLATIDLNADGDGLPFRVVDLATNGLSVFVLADMFDGEAVTASFVLEYEFLAGNTLAFTRQVIAEPGTRWVAISAGAERLDVVGVADEGEWHLTRLGTDLGAVSPQIGLGGDVRSLDVHQATGSSLLVTFDGSESALVEVTDQGEVVPIGSSAGDLAAAAWKD